MVGHTLVSAVRVKEIHWLLAEAVRVYIPDLIVRCYWTHEKTSVDLDVRWIQLSGLGYFAGKQGKSCTGSMTISNFSGEQDLRVRRYRRRAR